MNTNDNTAEANFTADREDIITNLDSGDQLPGFLVATGSGSPSSATREWAREYVEAITEALPYQADTDAWDAVIAELEDLKEEHIKAAVQEVEDAADECGYETLSISFAETAVLVVLDAKADLVSGDVAEQLAESIKEIVANLNAPELEVVVAGVVGFAS